MNKVADNKLSSIKGYFWKELEMQLGARECESCFFILCGEWLGFSRTEMVLEKDSRISESQILLFLNAIKALKKDTPLAHVIGNQYFYGLSFKVNSDVLVPRPETEELVELVLNSVNKDSELIVLDVGTGSGCIAISLKNQLANSKVIGLDVSEKALEVARGNANENGVDVKFEQLDVLDFKRTDAFHQDVDVIVSNPPYIPEKDKLHMHANVLNFDPDLALFVEDSNPLEFYKAISVFAFSKLNVGGSLFFEIHESYGAEVKSLMERVGFRSVEVVKDLQGKDRMVKGCM